MASGASVVLTSRIFMRAVAAGRHARRAVARDGQHQLYTSPREATARLAFLQYTSGSTSTPKGVMIGRTNLAHNLEVITRHSRPTKTLYV